MEAVIFEALLNAVQSFFEDWIAQWIPDVTSFLKGFFTIVMMSCIAGALYWKHKSSRAWLDKHIIQKSRGLKAKGLWLLGLMLAWGLLDASFAVGIAAAIMAGLWAKRRLWIKKSNLNIQPIGKPGIVKDHGKWVGPVNEQDVGLKQSSKQDESDLW